MSVVLPCESGWGFARPPSAVPVGAAGLLTASASWLVSRTPATRRARPKARRRSANARQAGSGCTCAPRPGRLRAGSGTTLKISAPRSIATTRNNSEADARLRQPTQVRTGGACVTGGSVGCERRATEKSTLRFRLVRRPTRSLDLIPRAPDRRSRPRREYPAGCRSANRSIGPRAGRSGLPARWRATAGSPAP
jgi:hypothetical protein